MSLLKRIIDPNQRVTIETKQGPVYPRVCGGTQIPAAIMRDAEGLSPRVRGNPYLPY